MQCQNIAILYSVYSASQRNSDGCLRVLTETDLKSINSSAPCTLQLINSLFRADENSFEQ